MRTVIRRAAALALALSAPLASCHYPRTEIVVRVETNMDQGPGQTLQTVQVTVRSLGADVARSDQPHELRGVDGFPLLPADLGITARDNDGSRVIDVQLMPIGRRADGTFGDLFPQPYHAIAPFESGHITELLVFLADRCRNAPACQPDETCGRNGCEPVQHNSLPDLDGSVPDASSPTDATVEAGCASGTVTCGASCVDLRTDAHHCGTCGNDCTALANVVPGGATCIGGACVVNGCLAGHGDCNDMPGDGCETDLTTSLNCGACGSACTGGAVCGLRSGSYACGTTCVAPTPDRCSAGCTDVRSDANNCGMCGHTCPPVANATPVCTNGTCSSTCNSGYHSCGGTCVSNNALGSCGATSCSACPAPANATPTCTAETCGFDCRPGYADCDHNPSNGCEANLSSPANCGGCGIVCSGASPLCTVNSGGAYVCSGTCTGGGSCTPANECATGTFGCGDGGVSCVESGAQPAGTHCSIGVCNGARMCVACPAGMPCSLGPGAQCQLAAIDCSSGAPMCRAYGLAAAGTSCNGGTGVCDSAGHCNTCAAGSMCSTGNPCRYGSIVCSSGSAMCVDQGPVPDGSSCPGGTCTSGFCSACTPGVPCDTGSPCEMGTIECAPTTCAPTGFSPPGTPCPGGVCNGGGMCMACDPGAPCSYSECTVGTTDCGMGVPMCLPGSSEPYGYPCSAGICDGFGTCTAFDGGVPDTGAPDTGTPDTGSPDAGFGGGHTSLDAGLGLDAP